MGSNNGSKEAEYDMAMAQWQYGWQDIQNKSLYADEAFEITTYNTGIKRDHEHATAVQTWHDKEKIRIFDFNNQVEAYNASVEAYETQKDYNALAANIATNDNTRKYNDRLTQIGFQNEELLMNLGFSERDLTSKVQASRSNAARNNQKAVIAGLRAEGKASSMGQVGRSARRNIQSIIAEQGRAQAEIVENLTRDERGYDFAIERGKKAASMGQRTLTESMKSAAGQYDADNQQIALQKWSADLAAQAKIAPEPIEAPQMSPPIETPLPKTLAPPRPPTKEQYDALKPQKGGGGGGGLAALMTIAATAAQVYAQSGSDDRLKYDITRVGTSKSGIPKYTFKYRADGEHGPKYIGTSAQDLIAMGREDAVGQKEKDGFYYVDYSKLDVDMEVVTT